MITVITHDQAWELAQLGVPLFARSEYGSWFRSNVPAVAAKGLPRPEWMEEIKHYGVQVDE